MTDSPPPSDNPPKPPNQNSPSSEIPPQQAGSPESSLQQAILAQILANQRTSLPYMGGPIMGQAPQGFMVPLQQQISVAAQQTIWQGEFPPPEAAKTYESLQPGTFNRLLQMAERRLEAQIDETKRAQELTQKDTRRSHWLGASTHVLALSGAVFCTWLGVEFSASGAYWVAGALLSLPVTAVGKAFVDSVRQPSATQVLRAATPPAITPSPAPANPKPPSSTNL